MTGKLLGPPAVGTGYYDRDDLYTRLYEVADRAGELYYIDLVLDFIADQTYDVSRSSLYEVNGIGQTYPFSRHILRPPGGEGDYVAMVTDFCERAAANARAWRDANLESIQRLIAPITHPQVSHYDQIVDALKNAYATIADDPAEFTVAPRDTELVRLHNFALIDPGVWAGDAARNFEERFYTPFQNTVRMNQGQYAKTLSACFVRAKEIDEATQINLQDAVTATLNALDEQLRFRAQDADSELSLKTILTLAATGVAILGAGVASAGAAVALEAVSATLAFAGEGIPEDELTIEGRSAEELLLGGAGTLGLYDTVREIAKRRESHYDELDMDLRKLSEWATANHTENALIPKRPDIAERDTNDQFGPNVAEFRNRDFDFDTYLLDNAQ